MQRPVDDATTTSMNQADLLELGVFKSEFASTKAIGSGARKPRAARAWEMVVWVKRAREIDFCSSFSLALDQAVRAKRRCAPKIGTSGPSLTLPALKTRASAKRKAKMRKQILVNLAQACYDAPRPPQRPRRGDLTDEIHSARETWLAGLGLTWASSCRPTRPPRSPFMLLVARRAFPGRLWRACSRARGPPMLVGRVLARQTARVPPRASPRCNLGLPRWPVVPASQGAKHAQNGPPRTRTRGVSRPWIFLAARMEAVRPCRSIPAPSSPGFVFAFLPLFSQKVVFWTPPAALDTSILRHFGTSSRHVYARAASPVPLGSAFTRCALAPTRHGTGYGLHGPRPTIMAPKRSRQGPTTFGLFLHVRGRRSR